MILESYDGFDKYSSSYKPLTLGLGDNLTLTRDEIIASAENQLEICEKNAINIVTLFDEEYPNLLKQINQPPLLIFVKGVLQNADSVAIAIVGTRACTFYGRIAAESYAAHFARNNIVVVSGLAYGIDSYAHSATVKANGVTYAVIACGIDTNLPSEQAKKANKIIDSGGALISQFHCGISAFPSLFLQRNRIISGISTATVVIESGQSGGSLNTARFAGEESRDVFALPGNISSEKSKGTNELIKSGGAIITLKPEDVLEQLGLVQTSISFNEKKHKFKSPEEQKVWDAIGMEPMHIDQIADKTELEISKLLVVLLDMEFSGLLRQLPGKNYIREH